MKLLAVVVPGHVSYLASFLLPEATKPAATIEEQLQAIADMPSKVLYRDVAELWQQTPGSAHHRNLGAVGTIDARRVADALWEYWSVAIEPFWSEMRAVLDEDVAYRAATLTKTGVGGLFDSLHEKVTLEGDTLEVKASHPSDRRLSGRGLILVPSVFAWPYIIFDVRSEDPSSLTYPARGVGNLWKGSTSTPVDDDALGSLLGRSRAAILVGLAVPHSTTELAIKLGQTPPAVSQHLAVLRRSGLVVSWRSGRSMMSRRTPLATSVVEASGNTTWALAR
jgi:DNA-binding transcriptional ArsR family regulator